MTHSMPWRDVWGWLLGCPMLAWAGEAQAQASPAYRVVASHGDTSEITCLQAQGEALWVGTLGGGVLRFAKGTHAEPESTSGLPGQRVRDCVMHRGALWVATDAGLARWDAARLRFVGVRSGRYLRLAAAGGGMLAADARGRILRATDADFTQVARVEWAPSALASSADGVRWAVGGLGGRVVLSDEPRALDAAVGGAQHAEPVQGLRFDQRGGALEITTTERTLRYADGKLTQHAHASARMAGPSAARITARATLHGVELLATDAGLFQRRAPASPWQAVPLGPALPCGDRISALSVHRGALWIGSFDRGLCRRDAHGWTQFRGPSSLPSDMVNDLASDGERLYVATARGLAVLLPDGSFQSYVHTQCIDDLRKPCPWHAAVNGVAFDSNSGSTWIADHAALHRVNAQDEPWLHLASSVVGSSALTHVAVRDGLVAVGSGDQGLLLGRGKRFVRIDDQAGLADNWVMDLTFDARGSLWVATCTRGVSVRDRRGRIRTLTSDDGLIDDYTLSVNEIDGRVWIGTLSGVSIVDAAGAVVQSLDVNDGLPGNEVHDALSFEGKVWLATDGGLSVLDAATDIGDVAAAARYAR